MYSLSAILSGVSIRSFQETLSWAHSQAVLQVIVGVLACPNLPQAPLVDADGEAGAAQRSSHQGAGCLFAAQKGSGAFVGPLKGGCCPFLRP